LIASFLNQKGLLMHWQNWLKSKKGTKQKEGINPLFF
jgi:hypothetical protein